ncbi:hypothetical protein PLESTM_000470200 [Pleodorina starrii]|nr:hypothetical protein PLESTM_000470200 [Pleodorina starrii]
MLKHQSLNCEMLANEYGQQRTIPPLARARAMQARSTSLPSSRTTSRPHLSRGWSMLAPERLRAAAALPPSSASAPPPAQPTVVDIPASQQEAVDIAVQCLLPALQPHLANLKSAKTSRGFSNASKSGAAANRFGVEIPVLDTSAAAAVDLASLIIASTGARIKQRSGGAAAAAVAPANWTIVHAREDAVQLARSRGGGAGGGQVLGLRQACQQPQIGGLLMVVEPLVSDVALVEQLLDEVWVGPAAVVLNPQWSQQGVTLPSEYAGVGESIQVVYSFLPCAIQGLLGPKEGAVLRTVESGAAAASGGAPWRILLKEKDQFVQVGAMSRRPANSDLEVAFINAAAASSPLTKTAKFLRGLIPGGKK